MMAMTASAFVSALLIPLSVYAEFPIRGAKSMEFQVINKYISSVFAVVRNIMLFVSAILLN